MAFVNDLDALAWVATFVAIVVCGSVTFLDLRDWQNHWKIEVDGRATLIVLLGALFLVGAIISYSPNATAPRRTVEGIARFVAKAQGKGSFTEFICATSCEQTGGYALALHDEAANVAHIGSSYKFTYLEHPVGGVFTGISLRVVAISAQDSSQVLYAVDLTNHPYRIAVYLLDLALMVCAGFLGRVLNRRQRHSHPGESGSDESDPEEHRAEASGSGSIRLGLESEDTR